MKYTLLDLTQTILSSMDSDEINSINDTVEAQQVVKVIRTAYFDILERANLPEHKSIITLEASGNASKPTLMTIPDSVSELIWVRYDKADLDDLEIDMVLLTPVTLDVFLDFMYKMDTDDSTVGSFTHTVQSNPITFLYENDKAPSIYTTFDDNTIIFDSYNSTVETTLQKSKTLCYGKMVIPFTQSDSFVPNLDETQFPLLLNEAKSLAWAELKQAPHMKAEASAKRGWNSMQVSKTKTKLQTDFDALPNFGRK